MLWPTCLTAWTRSLLPNKSWPVFTWLCSHTLFNETILHFEHSNNLISNAYLSYFDITLPSELLLKRRYCFFNLFVFIVLVVCSQYVQLRSVNLCNKRIYTVSQKKVKIVFVKTLSILFTNLNNFGTLMAKTKLCKVHSFSTSPNLCQCTTVWNIQGGPKKRGHSVI